MQTTFPAEINFPSKVILKRYAADVIARECSEFGKRGLLICGNSLVKNGTLEKLNEAFKPASLIVDFFIKQSGEPTTAALEQAIKKSREIKSDWVLGIGGGSAIDLAKATAGLFNTSNLVSFYHQGGEIEKSGIPFIAVPTTAGSGAEATPNAVITDGEKKLKRSILSSDFLAKKIILDAALLQDIPFSTLCYSAMDAWVQGYESFISKNSTWFSESYALKSLQLVSRNLTSALNSKHIENLEPLLIGSFLAGAALSHSRLGVIHGLAHPLGAIYEVPHGLICASCFVPSIKLNMEAMGSKYAVMSQAVGGDFLKTVFDLQKTLNLKSPFKGKNIINREKIIKETLASGSTAANPKTISEKDIEYILKEIF